MEATHFSFGRVVRIRWEDSAHLEGWRREPLVDVGTVDSVGYVVATDEVGITISSSLTDEAAYVCPLSIPWSCISKIEEVRG